MQKKIITTKTGCPDNTKKALEKELDTLIEIFLKGANIIHHLEKKYQFIIPLEIKLAPDNLNRLKIKLSQRSSTDPAKDFLAITTSINQRKKAYANIRRLIGQNNIENLLLNLIEAKLKDTTDFNKCQLLDLILINNLTITPKTEQGLHEKFPNIYKSITKIIYFAHALATSLLTKDVMLSLHQQFNLIPHIHKYPAAPILTPQAIAATCLSLLRITANTSSLACYTTARNLLRSLSYTYISNPTTAILFPIMSNDIVKTLIYSIKRNHNISNKRNLFLLLLALAKDLQNEFNDSNLWKMLEAKAIELIEPREIIKDKAYIAKFYPVANFDFFSKTQPDDNCHDKTTPAMFIEAIDYMEKNDINVKIIQFGEIYILRTQKPQTDKTSFYTFKVADLANLGTYGQIFRGYRITPHSGKLSTEPYAIKYLSHEQNDPQKIKKEAALQAIYYKTENPISDQTNQRTFIVTEWLAGTNLSETQTLKYLKSLNIQDRLSLVVQVILSMATFHTAGITHRDLHLGNIMIGKKTSPEKKTIPCAHVIDLGEAIDNNEIKTDQSSPTIKIKHYAFPPEAQQGKFNKKTDIHMLVNDIETILNAKPSKKITVYRTLGHLAAMQTKCKLDDVFKDIKTEINLNYISQKFIDRMQHDNPDLRPDIQDTLRFFITLYNIVKHYHLSDNKKTKGYTDDIIIYSAKLILLAHDHWKINNYTFEAYDFVSNLEFCKAIILLGKSNLINKRILSCLHLHTESSKDLIQLITILQNHNRLNQNIIRYFIPTQSGTQNFLAKGFIILDNHNKLKKSTFDLLEENINKAKNLMKVIVYLREYKLLNEMFLTQLEHYHNSNDKEAENLANTIVKALLIIIDNNPAQLNKKMVNKILTEASKFKDPNETIQSKASRLVFSCAYSLDFQASPKYFRRSSLPQNSDSLTIDEIKAHADKNPKSRTAKICRTFGL